MGLLTLLLVATAAVPAAAGPPGPAGPGTGEGRWAGAGPGADHERPPPKQATRGPDAKTRKGQGAAPRPARRAGSAAPGRAEAAPTAPATPRAVKGREPTKGKPPAGDDQAPAPDDGSGEAGAPETSPADHTHPDVRAGSLARAAPAAVPIRPPFRARGTVRPVAAVTGSAAPSVTFLAPPPPEPIETAAAAPGRTREPVWPTLPGAAGHPAFPGLLAAALLGLVALGFRGDRRDPKLRQAAIDDRDDRTPFP